MRQWHPARKARAVETIVSEYVEWLRSWGAADRTVEARKQLIASRLAEWGIGGMTTANIRTWLARPNLKKWTRSTYHGHLKSFCDWATAAGYLDENPMDHVRKTRPPRGRPRPLSEAEVDQVLSIVQGEVRAWILLGLLAGLRSSEIAKIRGEDVSLEGIWVEGKGDTRELLPIHPALWELAQRMPRSGYWFAREDGHIRSQQVSLTVGRLFHALGIAGSIHRCRHTYGTRLLRAGVNIRTVQRLMRHATLETTANYTAVDEDEMRDAVTLLAV